MSDDNKEGAAEPVAGWRLVPVEPTDDMLYEIQENAHILPPRGKRIWKMLLAAAPTPPAVMPAAPSEIELQHREALDCLDSVMRAASHVLVGLAPSEKEAKLRSVLSKAHDWCMAERAALSQTIQPQAEGGSHAD